jgi:nucleotide-binding universal stress UspA family protein
MEITWATDGSPASNAALPWLKGPLNRREHRITVVTAVPSPLVAEGRPDPSMLLWNLVPNYRERVSAAATELVVGAVEELGASKAAVSSQILLGSPPVALLNELNARPPDLLVMGAHGHGGVRNFLVGSVTRQVALNAPCSTLVVRAKRRPKVVLVAYDGSPAADAAVDFVAALPSTGMSATVLSVAEPPSILYAAVDPSSTIESAQALQRANARTLVNVAARRLRKAGWAVTTRIRDGYRNEEILAAAAEVGADLLAMGARGVHSPTFSGQQASGLAQEMLDHGPGAVLLARA